VLELGFLASSAGYWTRIVCWSCRTRPLKLGYWRLTPAASPSGMRSRRQQSWKNYYPPSARASRPACLGWSKRPPPQLDAEWCELAAELADAAGNRPKADAAS
jgi:hypothetical protein